MTWRILHGDCLDMLKTLSDESVHCCVSSPPYWGLRDYGVAGQIGLEKSPQEFTKKMVRVFREVRRVLRSDGTLWLNLGDGYASSGGTGHQGKHGDRHNRSHTQRQLIAAGGLFGLKHKDLVGIPWMVAFALRADGWYLRSEIIWHKPNPMPESVSDRPTKSHEQIFLFAKSRRYYYDKNAIAEPISETSLARYRRAKKYNIKKYVGEMGHDHEKILLNERSRWVAASDWDDRHAKYAERAKPFRNKRTVWSVSAHPFPGAHFATFPPKLVEPCVLAGTPPGGLVLDPFAGAGTTGLVALKHGRRFLGIELNPQYVELAKKRIENSPVQNGGAA
ncbi:MAG: hypothetical protein A2428_02950 [Bdellovibrionales bacterium RIFOXYC1_FULL_54_43]|nr:MAG: hypothetical protein A2428_02950 [Bdellovibrionales bacterium RIFOXYC1_FULL_54_43]OFZ82640.1 MAG: hypothetical protein A2603_02385 [Bdellovibrionales bacterium RIFOXYD1_FULL_55_31]